VKKENLLGKNIAKAVDSWMMRTFGLKKEKIGNGFVKPKWFLYCSILTTECLPF